MISARARRAAVAAVVGALLLHGTAEAASPSRGTITKSQRNLSWSGGPFTTSSPVPADTGLDCVRGASDDLCDHYALSVNVGDRAEIEVAIASPNACPAGCLAAPVDGDDYDLYVYAPDGTKVGQSTTPAGKEKVVFKHRRRYSGQPYEVRIVPWAVRPDSTYKGTVRALTTGGS